jgi:hypothetical protein
MLQKGFPLLDKGLDQAAYSQAVIDFNTKICLIKNILILNKFIAGY